MSNILRSSAAMGLATVLSRILGLLREIVYAHFMGDTPIASAFKFAFQVPNLFRRLLGEGALTAAFVPVFKKKEKVEGEDSMWEAGTVTMWATLAATLSIVAIVVGGSSLVLTISQVRWHTEKGLVFPPWPVPILAEETKLLLSLLRIMFPYLTFVCLTALCMAMLNARGYYFLPALGASLFNVVMICTVLVVAPLWGKSLEEQVYALAIGVLVAGVLQFAFQVPFLWKEGWRLRWINPWRHPVVIEVVSKMIPSTIGVAAYQLNVLIIQTLAFAVDKRIIASFDYAVRLLEFPQGVFGISVATYLLTTLSTHAAEKNYTAFRESLREGTFLILILNLFGGLVFFILAESIVRLFFERGAFGPDSTIRVTATLMALSPGLIAFSLVNIFARAFYALGDTRTPMIISAACLIANIMLTFLLIFPLKHIGMGIANTVTSVLNASLLLYGLRRKLKFLQFKGMLKDMFKLMIAAMICGLIMKLLQEACENYWGMNTIWGKGLTVLIPLIFGAISYFSLALVLGVVELKKFIKMLIR